MSEARLSTESVGSGGDAEVGGNETPGNATLCLWITGSFSWGWVSPETDDANSTALCKNKIQIDFSFTA